MTPSEFAAKWSASTVKESAGSKEHFIDLCRMLDVVTPNEADPTGEWYAFEKGAEKTLGGDGFADVWKRNHFAWESTKEPRTHPGPSERTQRELRVALSFGGGRYGPAVETSSHPSSSAVHLGPRFDDAMAFASELHRTQQRKSTEIPYVSHVLGVASLVLEDGGSEDEAIAALLHDAVEDQGGAPTLESIKQRFGDAVAEIVAGCSDTDQEPKPPWRARKEAYLTHLEDADESVLRVSLADKLHSARAIARDLHTHGDSVWSRFNAGREEQLWYYRSLLEVFRRRSKSPMVDELQDGSTS